ncbi:uncharacterized protein GGS22DRAFT_158100 [Annulohypoxylon maeteangense]|uniref:uncharacterized protein n=1 Tax=Annulohypoxylon maeteangense TaxID=1927788 RepID=UPI0020081D7B|nr:uncharacterized protein GGS22DRAFT_158100 [Annulohypoxylon maeteangense]KAI0886531.1 hypothetical protein GGS22DRAFT_158100 [Annulohypoxylon maeteangense]
MDLAELIPHSDEEKFLNVPYNDRWEPLRDIIVRLYMGKYAPGGKSMKISDVAEFMTLHYCFYAAETQYRTKFRKWGVRKRILTSEKEEVVNALGKRTHPGTSTSNVTLHQNDFEKSLDTKQLKRYIKDRIRHHTVETMAPGALSSWNLPYAAYTASFPEHPDPPSPLGTTGTTPNYLNIHSPEAMSPGRQAAGPSPNTQLVHQKAIQDRSSLFLQGRHKELLARCSKEDRIMLTNYLHDFYIYFFVTAKYWGRGPRVWTSEMISILTRSGIDLSGPPTPGSTMSGSSPPISRNRPHKSEAPTNLCRWSIHITDVEFDEMEDYSVSEHDGIDIHDPPSWPKWPGTESRNSLSESILESISASTFTVTPSQDLPISTQLVARSLRGDPSKMLLDVWKFAIMAGNLELLKQLSEDGPPSDIDKIHPFHLAASFLDGGNRCCLVIYLLSLHLDASFAFQHNTNDLGHTILDSLMISILRSHTNVEPWKVNANFNPPNRYPGEEKDICGRWDTDSPAVRTLFEHGFPRIPKEWKHPFCHTAAQAICHNAIAVLGSPLSPNINTLSGLFVRRCSHCGLELKLGPLHTLVVVAYCLARNGMQGESMFGALAILVCLLRLGADVSLSVTMSVEDIIGEAESGTCYHRDVKACDLAQAVPQSEINQWSKDCQTGWSCIIGTLDLAKAGKIKKKLESERHCEDLDLSEWVNQSPEEEVEEPPEIGSEKTRCILETTFNGAHSEWLKLPCGNPELGLLWATIQVELLTYRRVEDGAPWVSENFSMDALKYWLTGESDSFCTPLVERKMVKEYSPCGWFFRSADFSCPIAEEVCEDHFMNMDVYDRTSYIEKPDFVGIWEEYVLDETMR